MKPTTSLNQSIHIWYIHQWCYSFQSFISYLDIPFCLDNVYNKKSFKTMKWKFFINSFIKNRIENNFGSTSFTVLIKKIFNERRENQRHFFGFNVAQLSSHDIIGKLARAKNADEGSCPGKKIARDINMTLLTAHISSISRRETEKVHSTWAEVR